MRHPIAALVWEFWSANRRGWLVVVSLFLGAAVVVRIPAVAPRGSEVVQLVIALTMVASMITVMACCDFTDHDRRSGFTHFPRRLFTAPVSTAILVTCPIVCAIGAVVGLYAAWGTLVYPMVGTVVLLRWPATVLAAGMVLYQSVIWCLSRFRLLRVAAMSVVAAVLLAVGFLPWVAASPRWPVELLQKWLSIGLVGISVGAYGAAIVAVGRQRRGATSDWSGDRSIIREVASGAAHAAPTPARRFTSPEQALFWLEARRHGLILPTAVLVLLLLIVGPLTWINGRSEETIRWTLFWIGLLPLLLAAAVGHGIASPDFWSRDLAMPPFIATRPVTGGQIIAAKMKVAAWSTAITWACVLIITPIWLSAGSQPIGHTDPVSDLWGIFRAVYSPLARYAIPILAMLSALLLTWRFLTASIWVGLSGRSRWFAAVVTVNTAGLFGMVMIVGWRVEHPEQVADLIVTALTMIPWVLAAGFTVKIWTAVGTFAAAHRSGLMSGRMMAAHLAFWAVSTGCLVSLACLASPEVGWFRDTLMLGALVAVPLARVGAAPLTIARNRHR